ncbi:MAG: lysylphosphatidylglycerol synthase transmembrane domain-containing protein [Nitrospirota bacterium]|mgnify:FL=1
MKKVTVTLLKIFFSLSILAYIFYLVDFKEALRIFKSANITIFIVVFLLFLFDQWLGAYCWHSLLKAKGISISLKDLSLLFFESIFFGFLIPSSMGPDAIRAYNLSKKTSNTTEAISSILVLRAVTLLSLYVLSILSLILYYDKVSDRRFINIVAGSLILMGIAGIFVFLKPVRSVISKLLTLFRAERLLNQIEGLYSSFLDYSKCRRALTVSFALMFLSQVLRAVLSFILGISMGINISIVSYLLYLPLVSIITKIPISFGGLGIGEGSLIYFFVKAGITYSEAFAITILISLINIGTAISGGILYGLRVFFKGSRAQGFRSSRR